MSHMLSQLIARGIKHVLCDSTGRRLLEACTWFPLDFAPCAFSFADFAFYPFAVINLRHDKYMRSPMNSPNNSLNVGVALEAPATYIYLFFLPALMILLSAFKSSIWPAFFGGEGRRPHGYKKPSL